MLSRFSDVWQTAVDVIAPPATRLEDFEYHWKLIVNFYENYDESSKQHVEDTRVPHHLHQMLQLIAEEEQEQQGGTVGPCLEAVVQRSVRLLDTLVVLCCADRPPGARALALTVAAALLRRTRQPCVHSARVYRPLQQMLIRCSESPASPTEREEVELLLSLCGLVRKEPGLVNIFTSPYVEDKNSLMNIPEDMLKLIPIKTQPQPPKKNPLFEVEVPVNPLRNVSIVRSTSREGSHGSDEDSCSHKTLYEDQDKFLLIDLLLIYLSSADSQVVLRACEGIMIVCSLPDDDVANLMTGCSAVCETLVGKLLDKYRAIPRHLDPCEVDHLNITWGHVQESDRRAESLPRELSAFFSWLDYCDTLLKECHPVVGAHLAALFRHNFLEETVHSSPAGLDSALLDTALLAKCLKVADSPDLINEMSNWLVGSGESDEWPLLLSLINNCLTHDHNLTLTTLKFFECMIEKPTEHSLERLVLCKLADRGYLQRHTITPHSPTEEDSDRLNDVSIWRERERNREVMRQLQHEEHVSEQISDILTHEGLPPRDLPDDNIHRVINSFLLLLPRAILSDPVGVHYEDYIHDAHDHYQAWLDVTGTFSWSSMCTVSQRDNTASSTHSCDSRPEADLHLDDYKPDSSNSTFDEGPFLSMLFRLLSNLPNQPYQVNLQLTSILSKLAMLPHPNLHEYLLEPALQVSPGTNTMYNTLQDVAKRITLEVPKIKNYKVLIESTRAHLMSEDPAYDERGEHNQLIESLIVLEEFCKELAAIAFVKYQHNLHLTNFLWWGPCNTFEYLDKVQHTMAAAPTQRDSEGSIKHILEKVPEIYQECRILSTNTPRKFSMSLVAVDLSDRTSKVILTILTRERRFKKDPLYHDLYKKFI